jgi:hypothetical protein
MFRLKFQFSRRSCWMTPIRATAQWLISKRRWWARGAAQDRRFRDLLWSRLQRRQQVTPSTQGFRGFARRCARDSDFWRMSWKQT